MPTNNTALLTTSLIVILLLALLANYYIHKQQQLRLQRALMARKLKHEMEQVLNALATLKQLDCPASVIGLFNNYVMNSLAKLSRLNPEQGMIEQLRSQTGIIAEQTTVLNLEHQAAMKQAHSAIRFAIRFSHQRRNAGDISSIQCSEISSQLQWLDSKIEIDTHINAGKRLLENDKPAVATSRFKHAKTVIAHLPRRDPRRQELITEINQLIAQALPFSTEAMKGSDQPEAG